MFGKKFALTALAGVLVFFASALSAESNWKVISSTDYTFKVYIAGFRDAVNGMTAGLGGEVHFTTDGGKSWPQGNNQSLCRFGLEILDATNAWTSGNAGHVRVTHDGGSNWTELTSFGPMEPDECRYLSFIDPSTGWIGSPALLAMTTDGAKNWNEVKLPDGIENVAAINFISKIQGFILNQDGLLYVTKDAGKTWKKTQIDLKGNESYPGFSLPKVTTAALRFQNEKQGTAVMLMTSPEKLWLVLQTEDGGKTWKTESLPSEVSGQIASVYLSRDGKYLTLNNAIDKKIFLLSRQ